MRIVLALFMVVMMAQRIVSLTPWSILYHSVALCCNEITDDPMRQSPTIPVSIPAPARGATLDNKAT